MKLKATLANVFNIKAAEKRSVTLLLLYSLFMGVAYAFLYSVATSLFLADFTVKYLPHAYMAGGVFSYFLWLIYNQLEKRVVFSKLLWWTAVFLLISTAFLSIAYNTTGHKVYSFLLFTWINIFVFINGVGFWGIAGRIFNLQQGKRLFGLISSGEVLSKVISFFSVPLLVLFFKITTLLYLSVGGLVLCLAMIVVIRRELGGKLNAVKAANQPDPGQVPTGFWHTLQNKYFLYILLVAIFPLFGAYYVDFVFLAETKKQFIDPQVISSFLGYFLGFMSISEFLIKTFLSGYFTSRYGVLFTLLVLPAMLFITTFSAAAYGSIFGITVMLFSFIALSKLFVRVLRTAFLDPAFQILYQPINVGERQPLQGKVEGVSKSLGNFLAGGVLIGLAKLPSLTSIDYNWIFLAVVALWGWLSYQLYLQYRVTLKSILFSSNEVLETADAKSSHYITLLETHSLPRFKAIFNVMEHLDPPLADYFSLRFLPKTTPTIQLFLLNKIKHNSLLPAVKIIDRCLKENNHAVNSEALEETRTYLLNNDELTIDELLALSKSADPAVRIRIAKLIAHYDYYYNYRILINLLQDEDASVRNAALITAGRRKRREFWTYIIKGFYNPETCHAAVLAIKGIGEPLLLALLDYSAKNRTDKVTLLRILKLCSEIGGARALKFLRDRAVLASDDEKYQVFSALMAHHYKASKLGAPIIKQMAEGDVGTVAWLVACLIDISSADTEGHLINALKLELKQKQESIFMQLSTIYDSKTISFFVDKFKHSSEEVQAYALEILDLTISPDFKALISPMLSNAEPEEVAAAYQDKFPQQKLTVQERLEDIINKDYRRISPWTKCCAMDLLSRLSGSSTTVITANILNPNALIHEAALHNLYSSNEAELRQKISSFKFDERQELLAGVHKFKNINYSYLLGSQVVKLLKTVNVFCSLSEFELVTLAENATQLALQAGLPYEVKYAERNNIFVVLQGEVIVRHGSTEHLLTGQKMHWRPNKNLKHKTVFTAQQSAILLNINFNQIDEMLYEHPHLVKKFVKNISEEEVLVEAGV